jgi:exopolyphosphatase / guanosine-5'-triphosphate,3'-diphosphate pyrophosphatase
MRVGAIDIGTNSIHLFIADISPDGAIGVVEKQRQQVELGEGGMLSGLTPAAMARGLAALRSFSDTCGSLDVEAIHCAATSAVREAENGVEFCRKVKAETGIHVRVISGLDEARLIYLGARPHLDFSRGRVLLVDLGGGSTEFILCDAETAYVRASLPLGHLRATAHHPGGGAITQRAITAIRGWAQAELRALESRIDPNDVARVVGTSGTFRTLARMATLARGELPTEHDDGLILRRDELEDLLSRIPRLSQNKLCALPGMDARRKESLPAGAAVIAEIMAFTQVDHLSTSAYALRDGLIVDWMRRHRPDLERSRVEADPRRRSVLAVLERYNADMVHARSTAGLALQLYDATAELHQLRADDRRLLEFSALLHDIGHHISGEDHHKHGAYLLRNTRMSGFTAPELDAMSEIVRHHRGQVPKKRELSRFDADSEKRVRILAALLAVADAFDRGHDNNTRALAVTVDPVERRIRLRATTTGPAHLERWAVMQRKAALEKALDARVEVEVEPGPAFAADA